MSDKKKKGVGVQLLGKNATGELVAILQVRAPWNAEKNAPESYPGACQVTAHGKLEADEDFMQALFREVTEELGDEITPFIQTLYREGRLVELVNNDSAEQQNITFGAVIGEDLFKILSSKEKNRSFGGFKLVRRNEIEKIVDLREFDKTIGVTDEKIIAMFPDEKEAIKIAFEKLG